MNMKEQIHALSEEMIANLGRLVAIDSQLGTPEEGKPFGAGPAKALEEGLIVITAGSDVLRFVPPLIIEKQHVDEMIGKLKKALDQM